MTEKEFADGWINKLNDKGLKKFPQDFFSSNEYRQINLPGKGLILGKEFFGNFEILTADGSPVLQAGTFNQAKYIIYSSRSKPESIKIPLDENEIKEANSAYESYLDSMIKMIEKDYKNNFAEGKNSRSVVNEIFRKLNLTRH